MRKEYRWIDIFRIIAAVLVIANHTNPLIEINETLNYILIILSRLAVPFFFMTTGFFLISHYKKDNKYLIDYLKKTLIIYAIAIAIYIPLNIYDGTISGYFSDFSTLFKDLIFNGTVYHLWFLPASIIGFIIADRLVKKDYKTAFIVSTILYVIGIFGDNYYGLVKDLPIISDLYSLIFSISTYTRNGIFMAPIFFVMGSYLRNKETKLKPYFEYILFGLSLILMVAEGLLINGRIEAHFNAMYVCLLPTIYLLFSILKRLPGNRISWASNTTLVVYIIHIYVIVGFRMIAKLTSISLFTNNIVLFFLTTIISFALGILYNYVKPKKKKINYKDRAWIEIDLNNLNHNIEEIKKKLNPRNRIMAVVKSEAYGHGAFEVATSLEEKGISAFATASVDEAIELRKYGIKGMILVLGYTDVSRSKELSKYKITQTLIDYNYAVKLEAEKQNIDVHIKIDTGMHRLGFDYADIDKIREIYDYKYLNVTGIFTHLATSDSLKEEDVKFANLQIDRFNKVVEDLMNILDSSEEEYEMPDIHLQSSYGLLNYSSLDYDFVRTGISMYGVKTDEKILTNTFLDLKPVLSLKSKIILIRDIEPGESVSYSRDFVAYKKTKIAIVPIGYADGLPRNLSNENGEAIVNGIRVKIIGKICMDQLAIDITDVFDAKIEDEVTFIGSDGRETILATDLANNAKTITNEILSRLGRRLRVMVK